VEQQHHDQAQQTGTRNATYDVIAVLYHALQGVENCHIYARDAQDDRVRDFFQQALIAQRQLADAGKQLLQQVLVKDSGDESAFGWKSAVASAGNIQSTSTEGQTNRDPTS
jgi:hypothetical protein